MISEELTSHSDHYLEAYLDSEHLAGGARAKAKSDILAIIHVAKVGFTKPAVLRTRRHTKSADLDKEVLDIERVRAARRLLAAHHRRDKTLFLTDEEKEQVRAAGRLAAAAARRSRKSKTPSP